MTPPPLTPPVAVLTGRQDGSVLEAALGSVVRVQLPANASTGYDWQIVQGPPSVVVIARRYDLARPASGRVGIPGEQVFDLRVVGEPGHTSTVALAYKPPGRRLGFARVWRVRIHITPPASPIRERR